MSNVRVNAITLLMVAICLAEPISADINARIEKIFDVMDFDGTLQISADELVMILIFSSFCLYRILIH